ncbi:MAG TPA: glycosyltransferase family 4 protein [Candidatus Dormibacteraeota bacterium]|nr:glycosyltransferase family 4 protein [Candidatus Dormibacteraeota bacterium]
MKVAVLSHFCAPEPCAASHRVSALCAALLECGHDVTVITGFKSFPAGKLDASDRHVLHRVEYRGGLRIVRLLTLDPARAHGGRLVSWVASAIASSIYLLLTRERFDSIVVTVPPITLALPALIGRLRHRCMLVTDVRDVFPDVAVAMGEWREGSLVERAVGGLAGALYRASRLVVAVTQTALEQIVVRGVERSRLVLAPNGFDDASFSDFDRSRRERFRAVFAGNLGIATGIDVVLDAAGLLRNEPIEFTIVGDGADAARVRRRIQEGRLENVCMTGSLPRADAMRELAEASVAIVPLRAGLIDTIPSKMFDAFALALPVVVCAEGEAASLARASGGAVVVRPGDGRELATVLQQLAADPGRRDAMGRRGQAYVRERFERRGIMRELCARFAR